MKWREAINKIIQYLKFNYEKYNGDSFEKGVERETIKNLLEDSLNKYLLDSGKGVQKKQINVELEDGKEFEIPDDIQQVIDMYYIDDDNEEHELSIEEVREMINLYGDEWRTQERVPEFAIALDTFDVNIDYRAGTNITYPDNNEIDVSPLATIEWEERDWRKYFQIQIATDSSFENTVVDTNTTNTYYEIENALDFLTTHYVRVKAIDNKGNGVWSDTIEFKTEQGITSLDISLIEKSNGLSLNNFRQFGMSKDSNGDIRFYYSGYTGSTNVCYVMTGKNFANMSEYNSENTAGYKTAFHTESLANSSDNAEMCNIFYSEEDSQAYAIVSATPSYLNVEVWKISFPDSKTNDITIEQKSTNNIGVSGIGNYYTGLQYIGNNVLYDPENNKYYQFSWDDINNTFSFSDTSDTMGGTLSKDYKNCLIDETSLIRTGEGSGLDFTVVDVVDRASDNTGVVYTESDYDIELESSSNVFLGKWAEFYYDDKGNKYLYLTLGYDTDDDSAAEQGILYRFLIL